MIYGTEADCAKHDFQEGTSKQTTCRTPKGVEKQLDYILVNRKYYSWSRDAEANDMIHIRRDHRSAMARYVISGKTKRKPMRSEVTPKRVGKTTRNESLVENAMKSAAKYGFEERYQDLENQGSRTSCSKCCQQKKLDAKAARTAAACTKIAEVTSAAANERRTEEAAASEGSMRMTAAAVADGYGRNEDKEELLAVIRARTSVKKED